MSASRLCSALFVALAFVSCAGAGAAAGGGPAALSVHRSDFRQRLILSGELKAAEAEELTVPRAPSYQLQIRWLEEDGARVTAGQRVVEFDNGEFTANLEDKRLQAAESAHRIDRDRAEAASREAEKEQTVAERRAAVAKAELVAAVPTELLSARDLAERRIALARAQVGLATAEADFESERRGSEADLAVAEIALGKSRREIAAAEEAVRASVLTAPADGIFLIGDHPWEGRKLQAGDSIWMGYTVGRIPDLTTMTVEAALFDVDDGRVTPGMPAACTLDSYPDQPVGCRVAEVSPVAQEIDRSTLRRTFRVRMDLERSDPERMRPGMSAKVEITTAAVDGALVAPRAALDWSGPGPRAALAAGGWAAVSLGPCDARECVVEGGLAEGTPLAPARSGKAGS